MIIDRLLTELKRQIRALDTDLTFKEQTNIAMSLLKLTDALKGQPPHLELDYVYGKIKTNLEQLEKGKRISMTYNEIQEANKILEKQRKEVLKSIEELERQVKCLEGIIDAIDKAIEANDDYACYLLENEE